MNIKAPFLNRRPSISATHSSPHAGVGLYRSETPSCVTRLSCDEISLSSSHSALVKPTSLRLVIGPRKVNTAVSKGESFTDSSIDSSGDLTESSLRVASFSTADRRQLIKAATESQDRDISNISMCSLIPLLDEPGRDQAFTAALSMHPNGYAAKAYAYLAANASYLSVAQRTELLKAVSKLDNPENQATALAGFGVGLSSFTKDQRRQLLYTVLAINDRSVRSRVVATISSGVSAVPRDLRNVLVNEVIGLEQESLRAYGISKLLEAAHALNSESRVVLLNASLELKSEKDRALAIAALGCCFKSYGVKQRSLVLSHARAIKNRAYRLVAFAGLVDHLTDGERNGLVSEISRVPIERIQSQAFAILASRNRTVDRTQHPLILYAMLNDLTESNRIAILSNMLPALNTRERGKLIAMTTSIGNHWYRAHKLYELVSGKSIDDAALLY